MTSGLGGVITLIVLAIPSLAAAQEAAPTSVTVPFVLDHNRILVEAEVQGGDGAWHKAKLYVDMGSPDFFIGAPLARELGIDLSTAIDNFQLTAPPAVRIGGMPLIFEVPKSTVMFQPLWLFNAMHNDANLPSTVLRRYRVVFDYPSRQLTLAGPGSAAPRGVRIPAVVHPQTAIVQIDVQIGDDSLSFALDNGASYSFIAEERLTVLRQKHPEWPSVVGTLGCANMWGWWPSDEQTGNVVRIPQIRLGTVPVDGVGMVGAGGLGPWYSRKSARPVDGFLGANVFKAFRMEIDYAGGAVYFEKGADFDTHDQDLVGLTLRTEADGGFSVLGIAQKDGQPSVDKVEPGDRLIQIDDLKTQGVTMGTVMDALRGNPGETRLLTFARDSTQFTVEAKVIRFL